MQHVRIPTGNCLKHTRVSLLSIEGKTCAIAPDPTGRLQLSRAVVGKEAERTNMDASTVVPAQRVRHSTRFSRGYRPTSQRRQPREHGGHAPLRPQFLVAGQTNHQPETAANAPRGLLPTSPPSSGGPPDVQAIRLDRPFRQTDGCSVLPKATCRADFSPAGGSASARRPGMRAGRER